MNKKNMLKLSLSLVAFMVASFSLAYAVTRPTPMTPPAYEAYEKERQRLVDVLWPQREAILMELMAKEQDIADSEILICQLEAELAIAKIHDHYTGLAKLDSSELSRLEAKSKTDCGTALGEAPKVSQFEVPNNWAAYADSAATDSHSLEFGAKLSQTIEDQKGQLDLDKLAYAVAMAETGNCTQGMGITRNNCFGIKNGSIAPCPKKSANNFCIYSAPSESYAAFRAIWIKGYGGKFPTLEAADVWTGGDAPQTWLDNVTFYYNNNL